MYYAKLTLDKNALGNLTEILKPFVTNTTLHVGHLEKTTSKHLFLNNKQHFVNDFNNEPGMTDSCYMCPFCFPNQSVKMSRPA